MPKAATAAEATKKPDVLVILVDQWSPRYLSWDNAQVRTPNLDQIAHEGMIFDSCYTTSPVCMPARISLLTGLYPHNQGHALWGNATAYHVPVEAATMFKDIRGAGWTTAQIGKLHWTGGTTWKSEFDKLPDYYSALSLDKVVDVSGPPDSPKAHDAYARYLTSKKLLERVAADLRRRYILWEFDPRASVVGPEDYHDTFVTRTAANFIQEQPKDKPVCLVVSLHSPHPPLDAPGEYATMYKPEDLILPGNVPETFKRENHNIDQAEVRRLLANYLGKISLVDHCIGMLVDAMKTRGTLATYCVISSRSATATGLKTTAFIQHPAAVQKEAPAAPHVGGLCPADLRALCSPVSQTPFEPLLRLLHPRSQTVRWRLARGPRPRRVR